MGLTAFNLARRQGEAKAAASAAAAPPPPPPVRRGRKPRKVEAAPEPEVAPVVVEVAEDSES